MQIKLTFLTYLYVQVSPISETMLLQYTCRFPRYLKRCYYTVRAGFPDIWDDVITLYVQVSPISETMLLQYTCRFHRHLRRCYYTVRASFPDIWDNVITVYVQVSIRQPILLHQVTLFQCCTIILQSININHNAT